MVLDQRIDLKTVNGQRRGPWWWAIQPDDGHAGIALRQNLEPRNFGAADGGLAEHVSPGQ